MQDVKSSLHCSRFTRSTRITRHEYFQYGYSVNNNIVWAYSTVPQICGKAKPDKAHLNNQSYLVHQSALDRPKSYQVNRANRSKDQALRKHFQNYIVCNQTATKTKWYERKQFLFDNLIILCVIHRVIFITKKRLKPTSKQIKKMVKQTYNFIVTQL